MKIQDDPCDWEDFRLEDFAVPYDPTKPVAVKPRPDLQAWENAFFELHQWLDDDPDRRKAVIRPDSCEIWQLSLYIDHQRVSAISGCDLPEMIAEAMEGMVIATPNDIPFE
ncbi:MAG: hypothetical protein HRJ53_20290 [Acidobacteria bacterium Pan2503]|uniref:Uncharacterized protein n=1 Tax=Candidatus Acidiferrum panamense TaxID=2741543 RepID=A0A7V8SYH1_9BACT|nr:hypothetical protein [Candidatus Acidoferrum panamensis]